jgi:hypothetical protein
MDAIPWQGVSEACACHGGADAGRLKTMDRPFLGPPLAGLALFVDGNELTGSRARVRLCWRPSCP